ncbi:RNA-directed DNA polymerase from mobile element jockey [Trichonephila clavipes]|nr:RNA-directed DNA polymerase from mobile element jockey [Trichonephila clavipes]
MVPLFGVPKRLGCRVRSTDKGWRVYPLDPRPYDVALYAGCTLDNNEMSTKSPFAIHKALMGIGGELKSVKKLRSGDLLIETSSPVQTKSLQLAKSFLYSPVNKTSHKSLNSSRDVISEPD